MHILELRAYNHLVTISAQHHKYKTRRWHVTISRQPDGRPQQPVRSWKSACVHLAEGSNVIVLEQDIRSVELGVCPMQLFHFLITS